MLMDMLPFQFSRKAFIRSYNYFVHFDNVSITHDLIKTNEYLVQDGIYSVLIESTGFITSEFEITVACHSVDSNCFSIQKTAILSPELAPGETRIIMTWETNVPSDLDIHVVSVKKSDGSICRTYYGNTAGCEQIREG